MSSHHGATYQSFQMNCTHELWISISSAVLGASRATVAYEVLYSAALDIDQLGNFINSRAFMEPVLGTHLLVFALAWFHGGVFKAAESWMRWNPSSLEILVGTLNNQSTWQPHRQCSKFHCAHQHTEIGMGEDPRYIVDVGNQSDHWICTI